MTHDEREHGGPAGAEASNGGDAGEAETAAEATEASPTASELVTDGPAGEETEANAAGSTGVAREPAAAPVRPLWQRTVQLLLPAVLAAAAMGVHWVVNVPDKIIESPGDQGAKDKKDKDKKKKEKDKRRTAKRDETRTPEQLEADWETHGSTPFEDEPTRTAWARRHQVVINRAVVEARRHAFAGAPEEPNVVLSSTTCRTVRCRFQLRSSFPQELDLMTSTLERLHESGEPVWRSFEVERVALEPEAGKGEAKHAVQVTVAFLADETDTNALEIPSATPEIEGGEPENGGEANEGENGGEPENGNEAGEPP